MKKTQINLIPTEPGKTPSYYCTWEAQNLGDPKERELDPVKFEGDQGARRARNNLNDQFLFGDDGLALQYEKIRGDLYFVLDDGWDVAYDVHPDTQRHQFGSLLLNEERFPSCTGTPEERLSKMNERLKSFGWRGVGLWVASQAQGEKEDNLLSTEQARAYWSQRLNWSKHAKIGYWKVDWGVYATSVEFRKMLTTLGKEIDPELLIEQCRCMHPINNNGDQFKDWETVAKENLEIFSFSDVFRSYDVTSQLSAATTIDRLSVLLQQQTTNGALGIINSEDELYIGTALGCSLGIMRKEIDEHLKKGDEVIRAVRWQRLAPAFGAGITDTYISDEIATDIWYFNPGDTWASELINHEITQSAPIALTRGIPLPKFHDVTEKKPFVVAAKNPNGAVSIATLKRTSVGRIKTPLCHIELDVGDISHPIGIFGYYNQLTLNFDCDISDKKFYAQDLAGDAAWDITELVTVDSYALHIPGTVISEVGLSDARENDNSEPGLVLAIKNA